jgi:hypothetical protein
MGERFRTPGACAKLSERRGMRRTESPHHAKPARAEVMFSSLTARAKAARIP